MGDTVMDVLEGGGEGEKGMPDEGFWEVNRWAERVASVVSVVGVD